MSEEIKELLDYIANLQQRVEQLEKENKELKEENKRIFQNVNDDELLISNAMNYAELKKAEQKVEQLEQALKNAKDTYDDVTYEMNKKIEQLEKENKILKENAEHNDKVVDKANWENMLLKTTINESITLIKQLKGSARYERCMYELDYLLDELSKKVDKS